MNLFNFLTIETEKYLKIFEKRGGWKAYKNLGE